MRIKPFRAVRPAEDLADKVASPPYDVLSVKEARDMAKENSMSFLHIVRPEIDLPEAAEENQEEGYARAVKNLADFMQKGYLIQEPQACIYVYRLIMGSHVQKGIVALSHTGDYDKGLIKKHEHTRPGPEEDRTRHINALNAQTGPVFLTFRDHPAVESLMDETASTTPLFDFTAPDNVQHTVWKIDNPDQVIQLFAEIPETYIADGHHRAAAAARVARERNAQGHQTDDTEHNWFLTVLFPAGQLQILAYNRCVADLNDMTPASFLTALEKVCSISDSSNPKPNAPGHTCMYLQGKWYDLQWPEQTIDDPVAQMDVTLLQQYILDPLLGIQDPRRDPRVEFVGGIRGTETLEERVDNSIFDVAFSMYPTSVKQLLAVSDAGQVMPPKSTWFEPKLRSGLFVHLLD